MNNLPTPVERLAAFATYAGHYSLEQAIIYAYGLPTGGRFERHSLLIEDIRSLFGAIRAEQSARTRDAVKSPSEPPVTPKEEL